MRITSGGNVGIGTGATSPLSMLHVCDFSSGNYTGTFRVGGSSGFGIVSDYTQSASTTGTIYVSPSYSSGTILFKLGAGSGNTNQLVLTGAGNVGIGAASPASRLSVGGDGFSDRAITAIGNAASYAVTIRQDGTNGSGLQVFHNTSSWGTGIPLTIDTSTSTLLRILSSGNVGIGTPSPADTLHVVRNGAGSYTAALWTNTSSTANLYVGVGGSGVANTPLRNNAYVMNASASDLILGTSDNERMRITSGGEIQVSSQNNITFGYSGQGIFLSRSGLGPRASLTTRNNITWVDIANSSDWSGVTLAASGGNVLIGTTTDSGYKLDVAGSAQIIKTGTSSALEVGLSGVTGSLIRFKYNAGFVGSISTDGSTTAYNTSSDYRLKEQVRPIDNPLEKVMKLNPVNFKYKSSKTIQDGFIAHEIQEILPYLVTGEKDGVEMQEVDYSKLTPILIAAIKEQQKQIEELKNKLS